MRWYQGSIAEAVSASKKNGAVFVVYVEGKDSKSQELTHLIENKEVSTQLEKEHFVAIKIEENSVPHQQFSQIYKEVTVPSLFFIGKTGTPLEIVTEPQTSVELLGKLESVLRKNGINVSITASAAVHTESFIKSEQDQQNSEVCENGGCPKPLNTPSTSDEPESKPPVVDEQNDLSPEDKVERAQEIVNQKREAKRAEEEEATKAKEIERRKVGQDVQKLKRWQHDQELKELMDERNKEKKEKQEARQRVLAQIAQDKAERAAKFSSSPSQSTSQQPQTSPQPVRRSPASSNTARLQFRLPDGTSHTQDFPSTSSLQEVRNYIITNITLPFQHFTLSTTFPRREFTSEDGSETLLQLELVPNAIILILPIQHGAVTTHTDSWLMTMFWSFIGPVLNFIGYLRSKFFGSTRQAPTSPPPQPPVQDRKRPIDSAGETSNIPKKRSGETTVIRRQGNVHRLRDNADSDEDNNTWNGNSTQQM